MNSFRALMLVAVLSLVTGCAFRGQTPEKSAVAERSITIAVATTDELHLQHVGTTVFNNVHSTQAIPDWRFAGLITHKMAEQLKSRHVFADVVEDNGTLADVFGEIYPWSKVSVWAIPEQKQAIQNNAALCLTDYLLVLATYTSGDYITNTSLTLEGKGIHQRGFVGAANRPYAFVNLRALLIDCKQKVETASQYATAFKPFWFQLDKDRELQLTPEQLAAARTTLEELAGTAVQNMLVKLKW